MKKLNKKKIKWIVKEFERGEIGVWAIAQTQNITKQRAYRVAKKFKNHEPEFKNCGRKPKQITDEERNKKSPNRESILTMLASEEALKKDWDNELDERWNDV